MQAERFYGTFFHINQTTLRYVQGENSEVSHTCENLNQFCFKIADNQEDFYILPAA
jgi:hypothetical protein